MLKKFFAGAVALVVFLCSCSNQISTESNDLFFLQALTSNSKQSEYGSLVVSGEATRSLSVSSIAYAKATVYASDIQSGSEPVSAEKIKERFARFIEAANNRRIPGISIQTLRVHSIPVIEKFGLLT